MSDLNRIKDTLKHLNAEIEQWDLNSLNDEEYEEVRVLIEKTLLLLTGEEDEFEDDDDLEDEL